MKKIITILSIVLLGAVACNKNNIEGPAPDETGMVELSMTLSLPNWLVAETKAGGEMGHTPDIDNIRVAMFGTSGYPQAYTKATLTGATPTDNDTEYSFTVLLPVYEGECHVHIIANGDESITYNNQTEDTIMKAMETTGGVGAYWARIVLENGLLAKWTGNGTMQTNDNGNFVPTDETANMFKNITLIRNFAEVKLSLGTEAAKVLTDVTYTLVNVPTKGSVAPVLGDKYVDDYNTYEYDVNTEKMKSADGSTVYDGYMVTATIDTTVPGEGVLPASIGGKPAFVYERPVASSNTTCLLIRGTYSDNKVYYYRLDLLGATQPLALYRNYQYIVSLGRVGGKGYTTPTEAMKHNSSDNVSAMVEAKSLTDISDGESRLEVQYIEKNYVAAGTPTFWVSYVPDISVDEDEDGHGDVDNTNVTIENLTGDAVMAISEGTVSGKYKVFQLTVAEQGDEDKVSTFVVKATNGKTGIYASTLTRTVTVRVIKKMDMTLSLSVPTVSKTAGATTVLNIALKDTLQSSMFPLEFYIEDINHTLNPTGNDGSGNTITVPVKVANSLKDGTSSSFYFIRTVNASEYEPMLEAWKAGNKDAIVFKTELKTLVADSATDIYVANEYFTTKNITLATE